MLAVVKDEPNNALLLATRVDKMVLSYLLGTTHSVFFFYTTKYLLTKPFSEVTNF